MATLLRIDCSARETGSHSRSLADFAEALWRSENKTPSHVNMLDLAIEPVPHIHESTIAGFYTPEDQHTPASRQATALSDRLIQQFTEADALLISVPIYNFSIPSGLKAYIDQIVRAGKTFGFDAERGLFGLVKDKPVYIVSAYGAAGYAPGGQLASLDFVQPYLRSLLGFLGIANVHFFVLEGTTTEPDQIETRKRSLKDAIATAMLAP
ncbi:FMN-dependent NADH-azoreductase [Aquabacterium sp.]|uniref:FMN-dependent NADH-azoreductase n=1 Tax=Aquabacterium sp. TaxID=1872578 RepID=UPI003D6C8412